MTILVAIELNVRAGKRMEFMQTAFGLAQRTRNRKGCLSSRFYQDAENENGFVILEEWKTMEDRNSHLASDTFRVLNWVLKDMAESSNIKLTQTIEREIREVLQAGKVMINDLIPFGIHEEIEDSGVVIHNIYPNPFNSTTNINFSLAQTEHVVIGIHDMIGREVAWLVNSEMTAGDHQVQWKAGSVIPDGIYLCVIKTEEMAVINKVVLSR